MRKFVTEAELNTALPQFLDAPKAGKVETLCYRPGFGERVFPEQLQLSQNDGVVGDRWKEHSWLRLSTGEPDPRIQVCIMGRRMLDTIWIDRVNTPYPGDTMIADMDFSEANLPTNCFLSAGTAILQVSDVFNDACTKWSARYGKVSREWLNRPENRPHRARGVLCRIAKSGEVKLGDRLERIIQSS